MQVPNSVSGVPVEVLNPSNSWKDKDAFDDSLHHLAELYTVSRLPTKCCMSIACELVNVIAAELCPVSEGQMTWRLHEIILC